MQPSDAGVAQASAWGMRNDASPAPLQLFRNIALDMRAVNFGREKVAGYGINAARKECIAHPAGIFTCDKPCHAQFPFVDCGEALTLWQ